MEKDFRVMVFGKTGCDKCKMLNRRLDTLLAKPEWQDFEKVYLDLETIDGLVAFSLAECINPSQIPAVQVMKKPVGATEYAPLRNPQPGDTNPAYKNSKLYTYLGLQTDYSDSGVITPDMLTTLLQEARQQ